MSENAWNAMAGKIEAHLEAQNKLLARIADSLDASAKQRNVAAVELVSQCESIAHELEALREVVEGGLGDPDEDDDGDDD